VKLKTSDSGIARYTHLLRMFKGLNNFPITWIRVVVIARCETPWSFKVIPLLVYPWDLVAASTQPGQLQHIPPPLRSTGTLRPRRVGYNMRPTSRVLGTFQHLINLEWLPPPISDHSVCMLFWDNWPSTDMLQVFHRKYNCVFMSIEKEKWCNTRPSCYDLHIYYWQA